MQYLKLSQVENTWHEELLVLWVDRIKIGDGCVMMAVGHCEGGRAGGRGQNWRR